MIHYFHKRVKGTHYLLPLPIQQERRHLAKKKIKTIDDKKDEQMSMNDLDQVVGGAGWIKGGQGDDTLIGGDGDDKIVGKGGEGYSPREIKKLFRLKRGVQLSIKNSWANEPSSQEVHQILASLEALIR